MLCKRQLIIKLLKQKVKPIIPDNKSKINSDKFCIMREKLRCVAVLMNHQLNAVSLCFQLTSLAKSVEPVLEQKVVEPSIPGFGASSSTSSVPSFLRTSQQDSYSTNYSTSDSDAYSYTSQQSLNSMSQPSIGTTNSFLQSAQSSTASSVTPVASSFYLYSTQPSSQPQYSYSDIAQGNFSVYSQTQQTNIAPAAVSTPSLSTGTTFSGSNFPGTTFPGTTFSGTTSYSGYSQNQQSVTATAPTMVPSLTVIDKDKIKSLINSSNTDQPQKFLLESIRKQTELLRQKIQASTGIVGSGDSLGSGIVQSQSQHVPGSTSSNIGYSSPSLNQSPTVSSHMTSPCNEMPVSSHSSQYYQYNYHTSTPNPAPPPVPPEQPPLPSEPVPPLPLPTNDLPPMRRKRHR